MKTGICTRIGRQPPSGLIFSVLYSSIIAWFIFVLSSPYCSRSFIRRGVTSFIFAIERSEEHTSELQSLRHLVCRLLLEKKKRRQARSVRRRSRPIRKTVLRPPTRNIGYRLH